MQMHLLVLGHERMHDSMGCAWACTEWLGHSTVAEYATLVLLNTTVTDCLTNNMALPTHDGLHRIIRPVLLPLLSVMITFNRTVVLQALQAGSLVTMNTDTFAAAKASGSDTAVKALLIHPQC